MKRHPLILASALCLCLFGNSVLANENFNGSQEPLVRSALLGVVPSPASNTVAVERVVPNSTASHLGLQIGDVVITVNGDPISGFDSLLKSVNRLAVSEEVIVKVRRNDHEVMLSGKMQARPLETSEFGQVKYESVTYEGNQLRSIIHIPEGASENQKAPALLFIQGYTCDSIDYGMLPNITTRQLLDQFVADGYVVFKVEKPGLGDSRSEKHCSEINFTEESIAFIEATKALRDKPYVDSKRVYLFGHSLGVLHAAVVAKELPVAGIIGYGGVYKPWYDYMLDIYQEQAAKHFGVSRNTAKENARRVQPFLDVWLNTQTPWDQLREKSGVKRALSGSLIPAEDEQVFDRHYSFFRDLNQRNITAMWQQITAPVLMLYGSLDIQAIDSQWAYDIVSDSPNTKSKALIIDGAEHAFMRYESKRAQRNAMRAGEYNPIEPQARFDRRIGEFSLAWLESLSQSG